MDEETNKKELEQFRASNAYQKKMREMYQKNEFTKIDKYFEGLCYNCFKRKYVKASLFDVCTRCASKRGHEPIMAVVRVKYWRYCFICASHQERVIAINARMCEHCDRIVAAAHKKYRLGGKERIDPFWKKMRKSFGKDYNLLFTDGDLRR